MESTRKPGNLYREERDGEFISTQVCGIYIFRNTFFYKPENLYTEVWWRKDTNIVMCYMLRRIIFLSYLSMIDDFPYIVYYKSIVLENAYSLSKLLFSAGWVQLQQPSSKRGWQGIEIRKRLRQSTAQAFFQKWRVLNWFKPVQPSTRKTLSIISWHLWQDWRNTCTYAIFFSKLMSTQTDMMITWLKTLFDV